MSEGDERFQGMTDANRTRFQAVSHTDKYGVTVVEVYAPVHQGGGLLGVIYPSADGFTFASRYLGPESVVALDTGYPGVMVVRLEHEKS